MNVYMYIYALVCMYVCMFVRTSMYVCTCMNVCMYVDCESRGVGQLGVECAGLLERGAG